MEKEKLDQLSKVLGEGGISSILVAKEKGALLFADDLSIKQFAEADWDVKSVWSQVILANLRKKKIISDDEYNEGVYKLIIANYQFPAFNLDSFLFAARKSNWIVTKELERFMRVLEMPGLDKNWVVEQVADLIKYSVLEITQRENRFFFLDFIIKILIKGRNRILILRKLKNRLIAKFYLLPVHLDEILDTLEWWKNSSDY